MRSSSFHKEITNAHVVEVQLPLRDSCSTSFSGDCSLEFPNVAGLHHVVVKCEFIDYHGNRSRVLQPCMYLTNLCN